jgi:hypothetical protein
MSNTAKWPLMPRKIEGKNGASIAEKQSQKLSRRVRLCVKLRMKNGQGDGWGTITLAVGVCCC